MDRVAILLLILFFGPWPKPQAGDPPVHLFLTCSNAETYVVNIVDYKTNLSDDWRIYTYVTNAYTNTPWLPLQPTNQACFFRVGRIPGFW